uniref:hypothetical protein n=1 Tax=Bacillus multifaciens TaxID=3068506 RepID=UPI003F49A8EB
MEMGEQYTGTAVFTKVITPPEDEFKGEKIKPSNYLIQNTYGDNFLLYREIPQEEVEWFKEEKLFIYEGKMYVMLANLSSEENAMTAIKSYWRAMKGLNLLTN